MVRKTGKIIDPYKALEEKLKDYLVEIHTLKSIREEQFKTITELRGEIFRLRKKLDTDDL